jgi:PIN domain nuclease of toxin-antitoxin system
VRVGVDTHALLWFLRGSSLLSQDARQTLRAAQDTEGVVVSTALLIDLWYVTQTTGAFTVEDLDQVVAVVSDETTAIDLVPIDTRVFRAWRPLDRRVLSDPWDRLIVATALAEGVPLVTRDEAISASGYVDVVW